VNTETAAGRGISRSLKKLDLAFDFGGAAVHCRDNRLVLSAGFRGCGKTMVSYQGIALEIPQVLEIKRPFRGWSSTLDFFSSLFSR
jgi:hypothetical protein